MSIESTLVPMIGTPGAQGRGEIERRLPAELDDQALRLARDRKC